MGVTFRPTRKGYARRSIPSPSNSPLLSKSFNLSSSSQNDLSITISNRETSKRENVQNLEPELEETESSNLQYC